MTGGVDNVLQYHAKALKLIGAAASMAPDAMSALSAVEARIGQRLPASLREWYSLEGACDILRRYSNGDPPVAVADLGRNGLMAGDLLVFRHENQGVCSWAAWLNGRDDPPVFVDYDAGSRAYRACANTFSEYVYACLWDWGLVLKNALIQAQNAPVSPEALAFLRSNFKAEIETSGWPGDMQYRFFSSDQRILVWAAKDQADWWLAGDGEEAVFRLVNALWDVDELGRSFWSDDTLGKSILQRMIARASRSPFYRSRNGFDA
jgi:hypothetical protein